LTKRVVRRALLAQTVSRKLGCLCLLTRQNYF